MRVSSARTVHNYSWGYTPNTFSPIASFLLPPPFPPSLSFLPPYLFGCLPPCGGELFFVDHDCLIKAAFRKDVSCIAFLFEGTGATTAARYAFVVIGAFALAFVNEMIRYGDILYN